MEGHLLVPTLLPSGAVDSGSTVDRLCLNYEIPEGRAADSHLSHRGVYRKVRQTLSVAVHCKGQEET